MAGVLVGAWWACGLAWPQIYVALPVACESPHIRELKGAGTGKSRFSYRFPWEAMNRRARLKALKAGVAAENVIAFAGR